MGYKAKGRGWTALFLALSLVALNWVSGQTIGYTVQDLPALWQGQPSAMPPAQSSQPVSVQEEVPEPVSQAQPPAEEIPPVEEPPAAEPVWYDFSQPAPETDPVEKDYFKDAAFVGDSRTDGFLLYSGIGGGKNLTSNGLSIFQLSEKKVLTIGGEKYTLLEALAMGEYGKVYLSLGVNELGVKDDEGFYRGYCQAIDIIRAVQPNAVIYIQGLIPLNEGVIAQTIKRDYLKNERLRTYNELMRRAAEEKQVVFLDLYSAFVDENGELPADASRDGVHLSKEYCKMWLDYLVKHTVSPDLLPPVEAPAELPDAQPEEPVET